MEIEKITTQYITNLSESLNQLSCDNFYISLEKAATLIYQTQKKKNNTKLIFCALGKSGHLAKRAAASYSSTGISSLFIHPTEALHGDIGMVNAGDILFFISNSGNSIELKPLIDYAKGHNIPLIGLTMNSNSLLGKNCNFLINIPRYNEILDLPAPFISTNLAAIILNILNIKLIELNKFKLADYKTNHPSGSIAFKMATAKDLMHSNLPIAHYKQLMSEVIIEITSKRFGCCIITDDIDQPKGIITDGDIRRHMSNNLLTLRADEVMNCNPLLLQEDDLISDALAIFEQYKITNAFIINKDRKLVGILHIHDILNKWKDESLNS